MGAYFVVVFFHVLFAAFWIGSMLTLPLVLLPAIKDHPDRIRLLYSSGLKLRFWGWVSLIGLLVTGFLNIHFRGLNFSWELFTKNSYGILVSYKLMLFVLIIGVSAVHDFFIGKKAIEEMETSSNDQMKMVARYTGRVILVLALAAAFLGVAASRGGF